ncbi:hypothetical protein CHS0354_017642 [Potamilus streckersoni]|uniref:Uncharacterized protein n=1 Tax=Potamilus streckersoni TaxID=2493646 RepID=A0AAE0T1U6_9BIVA|nr:hypothetical protein CHS0354_017642 [Potamilus streckersoni]
MKLTDMDWLQTAMISKLSPGCAIIPCIIFGNSNILQNEIHAGWFPLKSGEPQGISREVEFPGKKTIILHSYYGAKGPKDRRQIILGDPDNASGYQERLYSLCIILDITTMKTLHDWFY